MSVECGDRKEKKISRSCEHYDVKTCTGYITDIDGTYQPCYCQGNGCNNEDYLYPQNNHQPLECVQCSHYEDGSQTNIGCKQGNEKGRACPQSGEDASCYYEVEKGANDELKSIRRGCSESNFIERRVTQKGDCDPVANGKTKCYCFKNNCNNNTPKGLLCAACEGQTGKETANCTTGALAESEFKTCSSSGASLNSCKEKKGFYNGTGEILARRECANEYREEGCDAPKVTNTGSSASVHTVCFCNTDRCIPNNEPVAKTLKSTANSGSASVVQLILSVSITLGYLFYLTNRLKL